MARNPWDSADPDLAALRGSRSFSWGRLFVGLLLVGAATVIAAYYVPLYRAHQVLAGDHRHVMDKAQALERQAVDLRGQLNKAEAKVVSLESERSKSSAGGSGTESAARLKSDLLAKFDKQVKKGTVAVGMNDGHVLVALADSAVFVANKVELTTQAKSLLCDVAKAAGSATLRVSAMDANEKPAAALSQKYPTAWSLRAERAGAVADLLEQKCGVLPERLNAQGLGKERAAGASFDGAKVPTARVEIEIGESR